MRRRSSRAAVVFLALFLLTSCGLLPGGDERTVTVWLMKGSASGAFLKRFTEDFERKHPDIRLDFRIQEWGGIGDKVSKALKADDGTGPDVIEVGNTQVAQYVDEGGLLDLTLESMRDWDMNHWLPGLAEPGRFLGHQYGIPWYAANRVVVYRKDLFARAGINKPPKTRAQWLADTKKLDSGQQQGIYLPGQDWYTLAGFIWDEGGELAEESAAGSGRWTGTLDTPAALRGMDFYRRLQALGDGPKDTDEDNPPLVGVFAKGDIAQVVAVPGLAQVAVHQNPDLKDDLGFFPVPGETAAKPGAVFTGGSDLVVPESTDDSAGAVAVISALVGAKWDTELARSMDYVPNKTTLAGRVADKSGVAAMAAGAAEGRATPASPQWGAVEANNPIKEYMTAVLTGSDPTTEAKRASRRLTEALTENM
ncbi:extracellular solute-binding protein [Streptomyces sp. NPDC046862]|uniref:extracellular solute-binding protein n=1 Tax=Streptomyces sp. NPDC046862 TaxID=3154603 RepID=UPI0034571CD3